MIPIEWTPPRGKVRITCGIVALLFLFISFVVCKPIVLFKETSTKVS
jgi:hypothetical protein